MHVACSCKGDGAYAAHSATMLDSVLARRGSRDVHVHYLHGRGFPSSTVRALRRMVESAGAVIDFLEVDPTVIGASVIEPVLWYRALVADLVPEVDRVLY